MRSACNALFLVFVFVAAGLGQTVRFASEGPQARVPFEIANNLVVVKASIADAPEGWFIFDTGAESTVVDAKYAVSARLVRSGRMIGTGSAGTAVAGVIKGVTFNVGNITASDLTVYSLPLDPISTGLGLRIAGIIGNDIIAKTVAEIDYENRQLTLHSPDVYRPRPSAEVVPITISENLPFVDARVFFGHATIVRAKMEIDTGSTGAVLFNGPFVRKHGLIRLLERTLATRTGGVGGTGTSRVARIETIGFGTTLISKPIAVLYTGSKGDNASASYDGLLGGAIFRRFRMTVDLTGKRLYLEGTDAINDPFEMDMSGMDLVADGDDLSRILVDEVKPASVAAKSGVRGGELIRSVNGLPAAELGLQQVRKMFRTPGECNVELIRGRRVFTVNMFLRRVI